MRGVIIIIGNINNNDVVARVGVEGSHCILVVPVDLQCRTEQSHQYRYRYCPMEFGTATCGTEISLGSSASNPTETEDFIVQRRPQGKKEGKNDGTVTCKKLRIQ